MLAHVAWALLGLICGGWPWTVAAQSTLYTFTMGVTSPAPIPGKPFTFTWSGGQPAEAVYIGLNAYFAPDTAQNIITTTTDILSNAPNNGSWTWTVPLNIAAGRHSFSIGYNPVQWADQTDIFVILASETSYVAPGPSTSQPPHYTYNGCGLPPLPDYTYTGYQAPCIVTTSGHVETIYANGDPSAPTTTASSTSSPTSSHPTPSFNTAFATGVYAQALQCPIPVTPSTTMITAGGFTTLLSLVGCASASGPSSNTNGICHTSGYTTFSVSGTSSVCCPDGWATTPLLVSELFCFTSVGLAARMAPIAARQASTDTPAVIPTPLAVIEGPVFTRAGVVTNDVVAGTGSSGTAAQSTRSLSTATGPAASTGATKSSGGRLGVRLWGAREIVAVVGALYCLI